MARWFVLKVSDETFSGFFSVLSEVNRICIPTGLKQFHNNQKPKKSIVAAFTTDNGARTAKVEKLLFFFLFIID